MKTILVTGASGFIAREVICRLIADGFTVIACARNTAFVERIFPNVQCISANFLTDTTVEAWLPRLKNVDTVINCVGVFQTRKKHDSLVDI